MTSESHHDRIDPVCEAFEEALLAGEEPSIEDAMAGAEAPDRAALLEELVALERAYRQGATLPDSAAYRERFPGYTAAVDRALLRGRPEVPRAPRVLAAGTRLGGYTIVRLVGRGGMGVVYEARHAALDRTVALKLLPHHAHQHPQAAERFQREARAVAQLHHGNIVPVFDFGELDGEQYIAMQLIQGESLAEATRRRRDADLGRLRDSATAVVLRQVAAIARALQFAHDRGVLHRDVKPSNILIDDYGTPWLVDFGVARTAESDLTSPDELLGTIRYMPPERFEGRSGATDDVYSLGVTLFEALTREPLFESTDPAVLVRTIVDREPPRLAQRVPGAPRDLDTILATAMARDPRRRYATAATFAEDLERYLAGRTILARRAGPVERGWRWARRNRAATVAFAALGLLAGTASAMSWVLEGRNRRIQGLNTEVGGLLEQSEVARQGLRRELYRADMQHAAREAFRDRGAGLDELLARWLPEGGEPDLRGWEWYVLDATLGTAERVMAFSSGAGKCVDWCAANGRVVVAGQGLARVIDPATGAEEAQVGGFLHPRSVRFSPSGRRLLVAGMRAHHVLELPGGEPVASLPHEVYVHAAWLGGDREALVMMPDATVWDVEAGTTTPVPGLEGLRLHAAPSPDGRLVAASDGRVLRVVERGGGRVVCEADAAASAPRGLGAPLRFSPDGTRIAAPGRDACVRVWDATTGAALLEIPGAHQTDISSLRWSTDGTRLLTSGTDSGVRVWDAVTGQMLRSFRGHRGDVREAVFLEGDRAVAATAQDGDLRIFDVERTPGLARAANPGDPARGRVGELCWSADGSRLHAMGPEGWFTWAIEGGVLRLDGQRPLAWPMDAPSGGLRLVRGRERFALIDLASGEDLFAGVPEDVVPAARSVHRAGWIADGSGVVLSDGGRGRVVEDLRGTPTARPLLGEGAAFRQFSVSPAGDVVAIGLRFEVRLHGLADGAERARRDLGRPGLPNFDPVALAHGPGGRLLSVALGSELHLLDGRTLEVLRTVDLEADSITWHDWSHDGARIAAVTRDGAVRIVDPAGFVVAVFVLPEQVMRVHWDPTGPRLAALDRYGHVYVWDASASLAREMDRNR